MAATIPGAGITTPLTLTTADNTDTLTVVSTETDPAVKARLKKAYDYAAERKEAAKKKTQQKNKK